MKLKTQYMSFCPSNSEKMLDNLPTNIKIQVNDTINAYPASEQVFKALIDYFSKQSSKESESITKRRKVEDNEIANNEIGKQVNASLTSLEGTNIMLQLPELSVQSPFRKKLNIVFGAFPGEKCAFLALTKSIDSKPELLLKDLTRSNVSFAAILAVPEKKQLRTLLIEYKQNDGNLYRNDPILLQFNNDQLTEQFGPILGGKSLVEYLTSQLSLIEFKVFNGTNDAFFVQAYKGSKEGWLYFLPNQVIFGFKKPILIFNSINIESITYSSITRLTFNVSLGVRVDGNLENFEFSMIDQKEFEAIDGYIKNKEVRDNSMAEELKAQKQLKNNIDSPGDLAEAARQIPGGEQLIKGNVANDDDDEDDANYEVGDSDDDHSDQSGDEDDNEHGQEPDQEPDIDEEDDDEHENKNANDLQFADFDENLQQELNDLQNDLEIDLNELENAGFL